MGDARAEDEDAAAVAWPPVLSLDPATVPSAVLRRLITEVQHEAATVEHDDGNPLLGIKAYDRAHNRHNRGIGGKPVPGTYDRAHNRHNRGR